MQDYFVGRIITAYTRRYATADTRRSPMESIITVPLPLLELAFRRILRSRHDAAGDLPHMFSGIGKLALQELRLNLHGLLKIGRVNQLARMFERSLHVLFGERQRLPGNLSTRGRDRRHRLARSIKKHLERFFRLLDGFFRQLA